MSRVVRYKGHNIFVTGNDFDVVLGKQTLAVGINDYPLERAKQLIDGQFETDLLAEIRKLPPTKR